MMSRLITHYGTSCKHRKYGTSCDIIAKKRHTYTFQKPVIKEVPIKIPG
jgi:hypothetical protein